MKGEERKKLNKGGGRRRKRRKEKAGENEMEERWEGNRRKANRVKRIERKERGRKPTE